MLKPNKLCNVCKAVKESRTILNDIYESSYYMKHSKTSLMQVHEKYKDKFSYRSLRLHVKNHQFMSEEDFNARHLRQLAKQAEKKILKRRIEASDVFVEVMEEGMQQLKDGNMTIRASDLIAAAKHKKEFELKEKDQQIAMAEMMWHFASGENEESRSYDRRFVEGKAVTDFDPTEALTGDSEAGADGPSGIHYPDAWDATPLGPGEVPTGNAEEKSES